MLALKRLEAGGESLAVNLGTGHGYSVREILTAVEKATGRAVPKRIGPRRAGDPPALVADPSRAENLLKWKAQRSLQDIVTSAWKWMQTYSIEKVGRPAL